MSEQHKKVQTVQKDNKVVKSQFPNVRLLTVGDTGVSNFPKWSEEIRDHLYEVHGMFGDIVRYNRHYKEPIPKLPVSRSSSSLSSSSSSSFSSAEFSMFMDSKRVMKEVATDRIFDERCDEDDPYFGMSEEAAMTVYKTLCSKTATADLRYHQKFPIVYGAIWSTLTLEAKHKAMEHEHFATVDERKDPLPLYRIIKITHMGATGKVSEVDVWKRRQAFSTLSMRGDETIQSYLERFRQALEGLNAVRVALPSDSEMSVHFLNTLDRARFGEMTVNLHNGVIQGSCKYPQRLVDAVSIASNWMKVPENPKARPVPASARSAD